jgi:hypothetical protein
MPHRMSLMDNAAVNLIRTKKKSYHSNESNAEVRYGNISCEYNLFFNGHMESPSASWRIIFGWCEDFIMGISNNGILRRV